MLKKLLLATTVLAAVPSVALAKVVLSSADGKNTAIFGGSVTGVYGVISHDQGLFNHKTPGDKSSPALDASKKLAVSSNVEVTLESKTEEDISYGAYIKLNANTSPTATGKTEVGDRAKLFVKNKKLGTLELGSDHGAYLLQVNPHELAVGTGGIDGDYSAWYKSGAYSISVDSGGETHYNDISGAFYQDYTLPGSAATRANKLTYYTPSFSGFSAGFSLVPDTEVQGTIFKSKEGTVLKAGDGTGYRNVVEAVLKYENKAGGVDYGFSGTMNIGDAKSLSLGDTSSVKRHDLKAYAVGAMVGFQDFKFAASYGNLGDSGGIKEVSRGTTNATKHTQEYLLSGAKPKTDYYSLGASYTFQDVSFSVTHMRSVALGAPVVDKTSALSAHDSAGKKNIFTATSFGASYKLYENLSTFAEYTSFKYSKKDAGASMGFAKGNVVFAGLRAKF